MARHTAWMRVRFLATMLSLGALCAAGATCALSDPDTHAKPGRDPMLFAVVAPLTGPDAATGKAILRGAEMALAEVNAAGGIDGRSLRVLGFDDQNTAALATQQAEAIAARDDVLGVIGHWYSACSIAGGAVYKRAHIPAITPGSINMAVTHGNPWYFSAIYDTQLPAKLLAHYMQRILLVDDVLLLHETAPYGQQLADAFAETAARIGLTVSARIATTRHPADIAPVVAATTMPARAELPNKHRAIVIATKADEGATLVAALRDAGVQDLIFGPSSFSENAFADALALTPAERANPGYYANGVYALAPMLYASANAEAQRFRERFLADFGSEPGWATAFAYDAARLLVQGMRNAAPAIPAPQATHHELRQRLRDALAAIDAPPRAVRGVTGITFFNAEGSAEKPPAVGIYRGRRLVPASVQLSPVRRPFATRDPEDEFDASRLIVVDDLYLHTTDIVHTGARIESVSRVRPHERTFDADLLLWFRHKGRAQPQDIEFLNAIEPIVLDKPEQRIVKTNLTYELYRVHGTFRAPALAHHRVLGETLLPISFKHRGRGRAELIYVVDSLGMEEPVDSSIIPESAALGRPPAAVDGWVTRSVNLSQTIENAGTLGAPDQLTATPASRGFSVFHIDIETRSSPWAIGKLLPGDTALWIAPLALAGCLMALLWRRRRKHGPRSVAALLGLVAGALVGLVATEVAAALFLLQVQDGAGWAQGIGRAFDILWWMVPALLINSTLQTLVWEPIAAKTGNSVPTTVRRASLLLLLLLAGFGILAFVFDQKITSLLATSGVVAMIVGLAIQINISNIVSGLILNMEKPFRVGDWIELDGQVGRVIDINWRATRLHTIYDNVVAIPNAKVAETTVINYHYPSNATWLGLTVHVDHKDDPNMVKTLLAEAVRNVPEVSDPWIIFNGLTDWSASYSVYYLARDYARRFEFGDRVWLSVWSTLKLAGLQPAIRKQQVHLMPTAELNAAAGRAFGTAALADLGFGGERSHLEPPNV